MNHKPTSLAVALAALLCAGTAEAQSHLIKVGATRYTTHSQPMA